MGDCIHVSNQIFLFPEYFQVQEKFSLPNPYVSRHKNHIHIKQPAYRYSNLPIAGFIERLNGGKTIITAEGYLMELDRRGYNKNGSFIPLVSMSTVQAFHFAI